MSALRVAVTGVGLWMPRFPNAAAWAERTPLPDDEPTKPTGQAYNRVNRRRASQMGRAIGDAVAEALAQAEVDPQTTPVIVGSSIGEASAMIGLLDQMWREQEPMSPAVFTVSVHNAASGLLSISMKNKGYTTSIAADYDTPAAALLEGIGLLATGHDAVCCVCADEASPRSLLEHAPHWDMLAGAVVLTRAGAAGAHAHLTVATDGSADVDASDVAEGFSHNPQVGIVDLIDAIQRGATGALRLDRGKGRGYLARLEA
ncbi:MAG: beta-ketoacyl synthase chain length factor [Planctomycetota bacterium]